MEKLKRILRKVVGKFGTILSEYYPVDENNVFKGYVCVGGWELAITGSEIIDIRVEGLETASCERISGVTNRVARDHNGGVDGVSSTAVASSAGK